jgi:hypothetical protein
MYCAGWRLTRILDPSFHFDRRRSVISYGARVGSFYDHSIIPAELRRDYDVYDRIRNLEIDLGGFDKHVSSLQGVNIAEVVIHESGLVYLSGVGTGTRPMDENDAASLDHGRQAAQHAADIHIRTLHWALTCGREGGDLNDVLYTVKAIGLVVSTGDQFMAAPAVVNAYSARWQSVFGGAIGETAEDGTDTSYAGVHARSAVGGLPGRFSLEPEMIVAIPPRLADAIIRNRGWLFPLPPKMYEKVASAWTADEGSSLSAHRYRAKP